MTSNLIEAIQTSFVDWAKTCGYVGDLVEVGYRDELNTSQIAALIHQDDDGWEVFADVDDACIEAREQSIHDLIFTWFKEWVEESDLVGTMSLTEILEFHVLNDSDVVDQLREYCWERDTSNPTRELLYNSPDVLFQYILGEVPSLGLDASDGFVGNQGLDGEDWESVAHRTWSWLMTHQVHGVGGADDRTPINQAAVLTSLRAAAKACSEEQCHRNIIARPMVLFRANAGDVYDAVNLDETKITFEDPVIGFIDVWQGTGDFVKVQGKFRLAWDAKRVSVDKYPRNGYSVTEIFGPSMDYFGEAAFGGE